MYIFKNLINLFPFIKSRTNLIINQFMLDGNNAYVWGMKRSGEKILKRKKRLNKTNIIYIEDGFIHSFGIKKSKIPLSICCDKNGIYYQKHMTHHILDKTNIEWLEKGTNCFLIRHPSKVINSYIKKNKLNSITDIGFDQCLDFLIM